MLQPATERRHHRLGSASRPILLLIAVLAVLVLGALWVLRGEAKQHSVALTGSGRDTSTKAGTELDPALTSLSATNDPNRARSGAEPTGIRLPGPAKLDGRVIERASGEGVGAVRVELLPVPPAGAVFLGRMLRASGMGDEMSQRVKPIASVMTDSTGGFHFQGVRQGTWYVEARGDYHVPETVVRARVVASGAGGPLDVYVIAGGRVVGQVLMPDGKPARDAKLAFVSGPNNFLTTALSGDMRWIETISDENGRFSFNGVAAGSGYEITATGEGFAISHALDITVNAGQDTQVVVQTRIGGTIVGRVVSDVEGGDPVPLAGAHLGAVPRGLRNLRCVEEILEATHAVTGADGKYVMQHVPPGEVDVLAVAWEHLPAVGARVALADATQAEASDIHLAKGALVHGKVVDEHGAPIAGVTPHWNLVDWKNFQFDLSFAPMMLAAVKGFELPKTAADGTFFAGPIAGKPEYSIDFSKAGLVDQEFKWDPDRDGSEVTVVMQQGSSVEGIVMDEQKSEPVTSFTIASSDRVDMEGEAPGARNPFSGGQLVEDKSGHFKLESVKPGKASLTFSAPGYLKRTLDDVVVKAGEATRGVIVKLTPGGVVRGRVVDAKGNPVAGAQVMAQNPNDKSNDRPQRRDRGRGGRNGPQMGMMFGGGGAGQNGNVFPPGMMAYAAGLGLLGDKVKSTNPKGEFELNGVEPGTFKVLAFHRDHTSGQSDDLSMTESGLVDGVVVTLPKGGGVKGVVRDRHQVPVGGEIVVAFSPSSFDPSGGNSGAGMYQGHSDASGAYEIEHVAPGSYFLVATRGDEDLNPMSFFGNWNFDLVTVIADQVVTFDVIDSTAGACKVSGTITYKGEPIPHGNLSAVTFDTDNLLGVEWKAARMLDGGKFEFAGLAPGEYQLNLDNNGPQVRMPLEVPDAPEMHVDLRLPESGLEGRVVDDASQAPIANAEVVLRSTEEVQGNGILGQMLSREGRSVRKRTSEDGSFSFERLSPGEYSVSARPQNGQPAPDGTAPTPMLHGPSAPMIVRVEENRTEHDLLLRLPHALSLGGHVLDTQKNPIAGATVLLSMQPKSNDAVQHGRTDANGEFLITGLAAGTYRATATAKGFADSSTSNVKVESGAIKPAECEIVLQTGVHVSVRVYAADGGPASGARADLYPLSGERTNDPANTGKAIQNLFSGEGASDANGLIDLGRYMPGEYRLEVQRGFSKATDPKVVLKAGQGEVELKIDLH